MPTINSINLNGISYALEGGGGNSQDIEDIKRLIYPSITTVCEEGEPITFTKGDRVITVTPTESGTYTQYIPELGTWTVEMESGGVEFSRDVEVENVGDGYSVVYPSITAEGEEGVPISFTNGELVIEKIPDESGVVTQYLPELGTWTVETEINGNGFSDDLIFENIEDEYFVGESIIEDSNIEIPNLTYSTSCRASITTNDYILFAGGSYYNSSATTKGLSTSLVDTYDTSFIKTQITNLDTTRGHMATAKTNNHIFFLGGVNFSVNTSEPAYMSTVDIYDNLLVHTSSYLDTGVESPAATTINNCVLCGGGGV